MHAAVNAIRTQMLRNGRAHVPVGPFPYYQMQQEKSIAQNQDVKPLLYYQPVRPQSVSPLLDYTRPTRGSTIAHTSPVRSRSPHHYHGDEKYKGDTHIVLTHPYQNREFIETAKLYAERNEPKHATIAELYRRRHSSTDSPRVSHREHHTRHEDDKMRSYHASLREAHHNHERNMHSHDYHAFHYKNTSIVPEENILHNRDRDMDHERGGLGMNNKYEERTGSNYESRVRGSSEFESRLRTKSEYDSRAEDERRAYFKESNIGHEHQNSDAFHMHSRSSHRDMFSHIKTEPARHPGYCSDETLRHPGRCSEEPQKHPGYCSDCPSRGFPSEEKNILQKYDHCDTGPWSDYHRKEGPRYGPFIGSLPPPGYVLRKYVPTLDATTQTTNDIDTIIQSKDEEEQKTKVEKGDGWVCVDNGDIIHIDTNTGRMFQSDSPKEASTLDSPEDFSSSGSRVSTPNSITNPPTPILTPPQCNCGCMDNVESPQISSTNGTVVVYPKEVL